MNPFQKICLALLSVGLLQSNKSFGADSAALNFFGLSPDGQYLAFEEYGIQDGSGFSYSSIYSVRVDRNEWDFKPLHVQQDESTPSHLVGILSQIRARAHELIAPALASRSIVPLSELSQAQLRHVVSYPMTDIHGQSVRSVGFFNRGLFWEPRWAKAQYKVDLSLTPTGERDFNDVETQKLKVTLSEYSLDDINFEKPLFTKVLQDDKTLPQRRRYVTDYSIQDVYVFDPSARDANEVFDPKSAKIIVFLKVKSFGFEGQDSRYMVVTGTF